MVITYLHLEKQESNIFARQNDTRKLKGCQLLSFGGRMAPDESLSVTAGMHGAGIPTTSSTYWAVASW